MISAEELKEKIRNNEPLAQEEIGRMPSGEEFAIQEKTGWVQLVSRKDMNVSLKCNIVDKMIDYYERDLWYGGYAVSDFATFSRRLEVYGIHIADLSTDDWAYLCMHSALIPYIKPYIKTEVVVSGQKYNAAQILKLTSPALNEYNYRYSRFYWYNLLYIVLCENEMSIQSFITENHITSRTSIQKIDNKVDQYFQLQLHSSLMKKTDYNDHVAKALINAAEENILNKMPLEDIHSASEDAVYIYISLYKLLGEKAFTHNYFTCIHHDNPYNLAKMNAIKKIAGHKDMCKDIDFFLHPEVPGNIVHFLNDYILDNQLEKYHCAKQYIQYNIDHSIKMNLPLMKSYDAYLDYCKDKDMDKYICRLMKFNGQAKPVPKIILNGYKHGDLENTINLLMDSGSMRIDRVIDRMRKLYPYDHNMIAYLSQLEDTFDEKRYQNELKVRADIKNKKDAKKREYLSQIKDEAIKEVRNFVDSSLQTKKRFLSVNGIKEQLFNDYLLAVAAYDPDLYEQYEQKISENQKRKYAIFVESARNIIDNIEQSESENKTYHLLDYYLQTHMDLSNMMNLVNKDAIFDESDRKTFRNFARRNQSKMKPLFFKGAKEEVWQVGDHIVTEQEKKQFVSYMKDKGIPLYNSLYREVGRRMLRGDLDDPAANRQ